MISSSSALFALPAIDIQENFAVAIPALAFEERETSRDVDPPIAVMIRLALRCPRVAAVLHQRHLQRVNKIIPARAFRGQNFKFACHEGFPFRMAAGHHGSHCQLAPLPTN